MTALSRPHNGWRGGQRLALEHVEDGARDTAGAERGHQGRLVHDRAAADVDEPGRALHGRQLPPTHQAPGGGGQGQREDGEVGAGERGAEIGGAVHGVGLPHRPTRAADPEHRHARTRARPPPRWRARCRRDRPRRGWPRAAGAGPGASRSVGPAGRERSPCAGSPTGTSRARTRPSTGRRSRRPGSRPLRERAPARGGCSTPAPALWTQRSFRARARSGGGKPQA